MPTRTRTDRDHYDAYFKAFYAELITRLERRGVRNHEDVAQLEGARLWEKLHDVSTAYPNPISYARLRVKPAIVDHLRREKAQRGEGSRAARDDEGRVINGRAVVSGDAEISSGDDTFTMFDVLGGADHLLEEVADRMTTDQLLQAALLPLSDNQRQIVYLAHGYGLTDGEIADIVGAKRETVNRKKNGAVRTIQGLLGPDKV